MTDLRPHIDHADSISPHQTTRVETEPSVLALERPWTTSEAAVAGIQELGRSPRGRDRLLLGRVQNGVAGNVVLGEVLGVGADAAAEPRVVEGLDRENKIFVESSSIVLKVIIDKLLHAT